MIKIDAQYSDLDLKNCWLVTAHKKEVYYIPVQAATKEEALAKADKALDKFGEQEFIDEFYYDDEWEWQAHTFEESGFRCLNDSIIK